MHQSYSFVAWVIAGLAVIFVICLYLENDDRQERILAAEKSNSYLREQIEICKQTASDKLAEVNRGVARDRQDREENTTACRQFADKCSTVAAINGSDWEQTLQCASTGEWLRNCTGAEGHQWPSDVDKIRAAAAAAAQKLVSRCLDTKKVFVVCDGENEAFSSRVSAITELKKAGAIAAVVIAAEKKGFQELYGFLKTTSQTGWCRNNALSTLCDPANAGMLSTPALKFCAAKTAQ